MSERERNVCQERERASREKQRDAIADVGSGMQRRESGNEKKKKNWTRFDSQAAASLARRRVGHGCGGHGGWGSIKHKEKISSRKGELVR